MKKQFRIKEIIISLLVFFIFAGKAQNLPDSVIMVVGNKQVPLAEFEYIARKNNEVNLSDKKSLNLYVEMFKNFKLKVLEAENQDIDQTSSFARELDEYKEQLIAGYLSDRNGEESAARQVYDRSSEYLVLSHILLPFDKEECVTKDTLPLYKKAMEIYQRIGGGEDFDTLGISLYQDTRNRQNTFTSSDSVDMEIQLRYEYLARFLPMQKLKIFEDIAYSTSVGDVSLPIRTAHGFSLIKVHARRANFGSIQMAYINIPATVDSVTRRKEEVERLINEAYEKASAGVDFTTLVKSYSADTVDNGILPKYVPGELLPSIENAVYSLASPGDITPPFVIGQNAYIFKLIEKKERPSFDEVKTALIGDMGKSELNFVLYKAFDDYLRKEYNYVFYLDAYAELDNLCDNYFPRSNEFLEKAKDMNKTLIRLNGEDFPQKEFAYYIQRNPFSAKTYSKDFMQEIFSLFVRDIATMFERRDLETKHPEIPHLVQEYRDGILLFELSNEKIWSKPIEEQAALEAKWVEELAKKYPVTINEKLLKKLAGKYR
ncbi:MAG: peptidylprolyl isomerase [Tannerellaceae bacterium]|jgi:peptidyl-prolyl cis-trans isomerase SurA|nr:peptidylprolyl isomerase [Tannerellaceae bacterium]